MNRRIGMIFISLVLASGPARADAEVTQLLSCSAFMALVAAGYEVKKDLQRRNDAMTVAAGTLNLARLRAKQIGKAEGETEKQFQSIHQILTKEFDASLKADGGISFDDKYQKVCAAVMKKYAPR